MWNAPAAGTGTILFRYKIYQLILWILLRIYFILIHRYAFVDAYSTFWSNQATGTVSEGEQVVCWL